MDSKLKQIVDHRIRATLLLWRFEGSHGKAFTSSKVAWEVIWVLQGLTLPQVAECPPSYRSEYSKNFIVNVLPMERYAAHHAIVQNVKIAAITIKSVIKLLNKY